MKYIEELKYGHIFDYEQKTFILTSSFKKDKTKIYHCCVCFTDGNSYWLASDTIVKNIDIFYQNEDNHLIKIHN